MLAFLLSMRFIVEMGLLVAAGVVGARLGSSWPLSVIFAVAAVVVVAMVWGLFLSPKARLTMALPRRVALEIGLFALAGLGLWLTGLPVAGVALYVCDVLVLVGLFAMGAVPGTDYTLNQVLHPDR